MRSLLLMLTLLSSLIPVASARGDTVIVKYRSGRSHARADLGAGVVRTVGRVQGQGARVVQVRGDSAHAAARLDASPSVLYAEPNRRMRVLSAPDDPFFPQEPDLDRIHVTAGWARAGLGSFPATAGVSVGVVDTGIDPRHEDLTGLARACGSSVDGRVTSGAGACADDNGHGSHVAGTIAAHANNRAGIAGVAFTSRLVICRALGGADGSGTIADVANCIRWTAAHGARIISMSLGGGASLTLRAAVRSAWKGGRRGGALLVAAAGNDGDGTTEYPAGYPEVVSVAAVDDHGRHAPFSNVNGDVEIAAPGVGVLSAKLGGGYVRLSGTSMAAPHVAGAAALLLDANRRLTPAALRARLDATVRDIGPPGRDPQSGFGVLDLAVGR
jgi:thermitase